MKQFFSKLKSSYEIFLKKNWKEIESKKKHNQLLSFCFVLPDTFFIEDFSIFFNYFPEVYYFSATGEEFLALGNIFSLSSEGLFRWEALEKQYAEFPKPLMNSSESKFSNSPLFLAAVKFDAERKSSEWSNFKNSEFYIPRFLIKLEKDSPLFRFNVLVDDTFSVESSVLDFSSSLTTIFQKTTKQQAATSIEYEKTTSQSSDIESWNIKVENALAEIKNTSLTKVVLARKISFKMTNRLQIESLLSKLKKTNPYSHLFYIKKNDSVFFGASPEILIELKKKVILTEAIAGSRKRGETPEEDVLLENELRNSEKEIKEHRSVLDFLIERLTPFTSEIKYTKIPNVKKLAAIQHLSTDISAEIKTGSSLFSIVDKIFPTPAVCGSPKGKAHSLISQLENFDRGLYAGLVGWISPSSAKLVVAIRSALINKNTIFVYAGCGIVEGSNPESEFAETETKFKTILSALNEKN